MATAFFLPLANLFASLQALAEWFAPQARAACSAPAQAPASSRPAHRPPAQRLPGQGPVRLPAAKPLRVVRVVEAAASRSTAGRMVISGRLADVCAELDRMAAQEARGH